MLSMAKAIQYILLGPLRAIEIEHVHEKGWIYLSESLLALTIFRDAFQGGNILHFCVIVFMHYFHWLVADRVDWMEHAVATGESWWRSLRLHVLMVLLTAADTLALYYSINHVTRYGPSVQLLFGMEVS